MAPEYSKAAGSLSPLVPFYAVDCDTESNRQLCASQVRKNAPWSTRECDADVWGSHIRIQEVQGFPTVKVFPRGGQLPGQKYEAGERTSNKLIKWASRSVPNKIKVMPNEDDISEWLDKVRFFIYACSFYSIPRLTPASLHRPTRVASDVCRCTEHRLATRHFVQQGQEIPTVVAGPRE